MTKIPKAKGVPITPKTAMIIAISAVVSLLLSDGASGDTKKDEDGGGTMSTTMNL